MDLDELLHETKILHGAIILIGRMERQRQRGCNQKADVGEPMRIGDEMAHLFWLSDAQWAVIEQRRTGSRARDQDRVPLVGLPSGLRSCNDRLQQVQQVVAAGLWRGMRRSSMT